MRTIMDKKADLFPKYFIHKDVNICVNTLIQ